MSSFFANNPKKAKSAIEESLNNDGTLRSTVNISVVSYRKKGYTSLATLELEPGDRVTREKDSYLCEDAAGSTVQLFV